MGECPLNRGPYGGALWMSPPESPQAVPCLPTIIIGRVRINFKQWMGPINVCRIPGGGGGGGGGWALRYGGGGGGGRTRVTYFAEERVFFKDLRMSAIL